MLLPWNFITAPFLQFFLNPMPLSISRHVICTKKRKNEKTGRNNSTKYMEKEIEHEVWRRTREKVQEEMKTWIPLDVVNMKTGDGMPFHIKTILLFSILHHKISMFICVKERCFFPSQKDFSCFYFWRKKGISEPEAKKCRLFFSSGLHCQSFFFRTILVISYSSLNTLVYFFCILFTLLSHKLCHKWYSHGYFHSFPLSSKNTVH